jgi:predicted HicB family RNase H-like nuclease
MQSKKGDIKMEKGYEYNKKYAQEYLKKFDEIKLRVPKGKREEYKAKAEAAGKSLNQYIIECVEKGLE